MTEEEIKNNNKLIEDILLNGDIELIYNLFGKEGIDLSIEIGGTTKETAEEFYAKNNISK